MATFIYYAVTITGACTLTAGMFALVDLIERPRKRRQGRSH